MTTNQHQAIPPAFTYKMWIEKRWSDLDEARIVNNAKIMTYLEETRIRFLRENIGWDFDRHGLVVAHANIDFRRPITLTDQPWAYLNVGKIGEKSIALDCLIAEQVGSEWRVFTEARFVVVSFDYAAKVSVPIPAHLRKRLVG